MATFRVKRIVDAYVMTYAEIEADSPEEAAQLAQDDEGKYTWGDEDVITYDDRAFVTLDDSEEEIEGTQVGDF